MIGLANLGDGQPRCYWHGGDPLYMSYHDKEWGRPQADDRLLFEKICLEGFQAGLSWLTILRKRENFRSRFDNFDIDRVAGYGGSKIEALLQNKGIVRHRRKIESVVNNARRACELREEWGSLAAYFWQYEPEEGDRPHRITYEVFRNLTQTPESKALSADLKRRGWSFVGPTTAYAFMQAVGLVNDHIEGCCVRDEIERSRQHFVRP